MWLPQANLVKDGMHKSYMQTAGLLHISRMVAWRMRRTTAVTLAVRDGHGVIQQPPPDGNTAYCRILYAVSTRESEYLSKLQETKYILRY